VQIPRRAIKGSNLNGTRIGRRRYSFRIIKLSNGEDIADSPEIVDCRNLGIVVSKSRYGTSRLRSLTNHYKFIENNLIPGCGSNKKLSRALHRSRDFRARISIDRERRRGRDSRNTLLSGSPEVKSILPDSNMEIQIQMYGNAFAPITLINHGYAAILILFRSGTRSSYEVISRLIAPAGATRDKPKIAPPRSLIHTERNRLSHLETASGAREFYPAAS
jgi:hypothetical protein